METFPGRAQSVLERDRAAIRVGREARLRAFSALRHIHELATRTGELRNIYVFGSFVSSTRHPRDVDVILVMADSFLLEGCTQASRPLFSHAEAQARYGATVFWLREGMLARVSMEEFLRVWQTTRDGRIRGILEIA